MKIYFDCTNLINEVFLKISCDKFLIGNIILKNEACNIYVDIPTPNSELVMELCNINNHHSTLHTVKVSDMNSEIDDAISLSKKNQNASLESKCAKKTPKVSFFDYAGGSDVLGFNQAYKTVIKNFSDDIAELYCKFYVLNVIDGTVVKLVAAKEKKHKYLPEEKLIQEFKRIPSQADLDKCLKKAEKMFLIKFACVILMVLIYELVLVQFFLNIKNALKLLMALIGIIFLSWGWLSYSTVKEGYIVMSENECIYPETMKDVLVFAWEHENAEDNDADSWVQIAGKYNEKFLKADKKKNK